MALCDSAHVVVLPNIDSIAPLLRKISKIASIRNIQLRGKEFRVAAPEFAAEVAADEHLRSIVTWSMHP
jgi:hypothetical protein